MSEHNEPSPSEPSGPDIRNMVRAALFAALIAVGSYLIVPLPFSPVPVALQSFFILLAGLTLGEKWGTASVAVFLLAGIAGFPVFSGGKGGIVHLAGPTGGYLISYLPAVFLTGFLSRRISVRTVIGRRFREVLILTAATSVIYLIGVSWLSIWSAFISSSRTSLSITGALGLGMIPFLPGDIFKIIFAAGISPYLRRFLSDASDPVRRGDGGVSE